MKGSGCQEGKWTKKTARIPVNNNDNDTPFVSEVTTSKFPYIESFVLPVKE